MNEKGATLQNLLNEMGAASIGEGRPEHVEPAMLPLSLRERRPFNVPFNSKGANFVGRAGLLEDIWKALSESATVAIGQAVGIEGMGGLGKTQLAVEYAYKYDHKYPNGVIWFTADGDMEGQLRQIALESGWVNELDNPENQLSVARQVLKNLRNALLIFDNVERIETVEPYFPKFEADTHILATSRFPIAEFDVLNITTLSDEESEVLLSTTAKRIIANEDIPSLEQIVKDLDGLPLALEIAGAYLRMKPSVSWSKYSDLLKNRISQALPSNLAKAGFTRHEEDVFQTLSISEEIFGESRYLKEIVDLLAWSGSSSMGLSLMAAVLGVEEIDLEDGLGLGVSLSLLRKDTEVDRYSIHRLLAKVRREEISLKKRKEWVGVCAERLGDWFYKIKEEFAKLSEFENELEHLEAWEKNAEAHFPEKAVKLIYLKAYPAYHRGLYKYAEKWTGEAHLQYESRGLDNRVLLAAILNDLGFLSTYRGAPKKGLEFFKQALEIRREILGEKHTDYAELLNNIGSTYEDLGDYPRALEFHKQALEIQREVLGEKHRNYARSLNNIGTTSSAIGDYPRALEFHKQALEIQREILGEKHPDCTTSLNNTGLTYAEMGNHSKAVEFYKQSLEIRRDVLGEKHPDYATSLSNIGWSLLDLNDAIAANACFEEAVSIWTETFGDKHKRTQIAKRGLEKARIALGGKEEAIRIQLAKKKKRPRMRK